MRRRTVSGVVWIMGLSLLAAALTAVFHPMAPPWFQVDSTDKLQWRISLAEARALMDTGPVLWVDARTPSDFEHGHVAGAVLIDPDQLGLSLFNHMDALQEALDRPVIVYCDGDGCQRSSDVAGELRDQLGLSPVHVLKGDWRLLPTVGKD